jgi:hypothetical protein
MYVYPSARVKSDSHRTDSRESLQFYNLNMTNCIPIFLNTDTKQTQVQLQSLAMTDLRNLDTIFCARYEMRPMKKLNIEHDIAIAHFDNADCVDCTSHRWRYRRSKVTLLPRYGEITKRFSGKNFTNLICRERLCKESLLCTFFTSPMRATCPYI